MSRRHVRLALAAIALSGIAAMSSADAQPASPCETPEHHAFDFWLGTWDVFKPDGTLAGRNRIEREYGCVLHEQYETPKGYRGGSFNIYDASRKVWHQTWVDNTGVMLVLEGGMRDGSMVLEGESVGSDAKLTKQRITWTPNADGSVRQHWESGNADGTWTTAFDGRYIRVDAGADSENDVR